MTRLLHQFPCGRVVVETTRQIGGVSITHSAGQLPDAFRTMRYGSVIHLEPPVGAGTDAGFAEFLDALRDTSEKNAPTIIASAAIR